VKPDRQQPGNLLNARALWSVGMINRCAPAGRIPDPHRAVVAGAGQQLVIGYGDRAKPIAPVLVAFRMARCPPVAGVPDPHHAVVAGAANSRGIFEGADWCLMVLIWAGLR
jgi:hypothetical protein